MALFRETPSIPDNTFLKTSEGEMINFSTEKSPTLDLVRELWESQNILFVCGDDVECWILQHHLKRIQKIIKKLSDIDISRQEFDHHVRSQRLWYCTPSSSKEIEYIPRTRYDLVPLSLFLWDRILQEMHPRLVELCQKIIRFDVHGVGVMKIDWYQDFNTSQRMVLSNVILAAFFWADEIDEKVGELSPESQEKYLSLSFRFRQIEKLLYPQPPSSEIITLETIQEKDPIIKNFAEFLRENVSSYAVKLYITATNLNFDALAPEQQFFIRMILVESRIRASNTSPHCQFNCSENCCQSYMERLGVDYVVHDGPKLCPCPDDMIV